MNRKRLLNFEVHELEADSILETHLGEGGAKGGDSGGNGGKSDSASQDPTGMGPDGMFSGISSDDLGDVGNEGGGAPPQDPTGMSGYGMFSPGRDVFGNAINAFGPGEDFSGEASGSDLLMGVNRFFDIKSKITNRNKVLGVVDTLGSSAEKISGKLNPNGTYGKITSDPTVKAAVESNAFSRVGMVTAAAATDVSEDVTKNALAPAGQAIADFSARQVQSAISSVTSASGGEGDDSGFGGGGLSHDAPPVVLDLDGDGIELVPLDDSQNFYDFDGDGRGNQTAWVSSDDGILALDAGNDRMIQNADEIRFDGYAQRAEEEGDVTKHDFNNDDAVDIRDFDTDGNGVVSDLEGLRYFDSNKDGVLDSADEQFDSFGVFSDFDDDGVTGSREFRTLSEMGITSINLSSDSIDRVQSGDAIVGMGTYTKTDGSQGALADVVLEYDPGEYGILEGSGGDDALSADDDQSAVIYGGAGDDAIEGSLKGDLLSGNSGQDDLRGRLGDDVYVFGRGFGHDVLSDQYGITWNHYSDSGWIGDDGKRTFDRSFKDAAPMGKKDTKTITWRYYSSSGWAGTDIDGNVFDKNHDRVAPSGEEGKRRVTWNFYSKLKRTGTNDAPSWVEIGSGWVGTDGTGKTFDLDGNPVTPVGHKDVKLRGYDYWSGIYDGYYGDRVDPVNKAYDVAPVKKEYAMSSDFQEYNAGHDTLALGEGVALGDLAFKKDGGDLKIGILEDSQVAADLDAASFKTLSDIVTLKDFFNENKRIETLSFSDGGVLDLNRVVETSHIQDGEVIHADESLIRYFESQGVELSTYDSISARSSTAGDEGNNDLSANYNEPAVIYGGGGDDAISGSQGKDMVSGDGGDDVLRGSLGDDDYIFGRGFGHDTLTDDYSVTWNHYSTSGWIGTDDAGRVFDENFNDATPSGKMDTQNITWRHYSNSGWAGRDVDGNYINKSGNRVSPSGQIDSGKITWNFYSLRKYNSGSKSFFEVGSGWVGTDSAGNVFDENRNPITPVGVKDVRQAFIDMLGMYNYPVAPRTETYRIAPQSGEFGVASRSEQYDAGDDTLILGQGIALSDLAFKVENGDLKIGLLDQTQRDASLDAASFDALADIVTLTDFFNGKRRIENLRFSDGATLDLAEVAKFTGLTEATELQVFKPNDAMMTHLAGQGLAIVGYDTGFAADPVMTQTDNELSGTALNDIIDGGQGNDTISGEEGNDMLAGGLGNDVLSGGAGDDAYRFDPGDGRDVIINKDPDSSNDRLVFGDGIDTGDLWFERRNDDLLVEIAGTEDAVTIKDWYLGDEYKLDRFEASSGSPIMASDVFGLLNNGDDHFRAYYDRSADMSGGAGDDTLEGSWRGDRLSGDSGADTLKGGAGDDEYVFGRGFGRDTIDDHYNVTWNHYSKSGWIGTDDLGKTFDENFDPAAPSGTKDREVVTWEYYSGSGWVGTDIDGNVFDEDRNPVTPSGTKGVQTLTWTHYASYNGGGSGWVATDGTGKTFDDSGNPVVPKGTRNREWVDIGEFGGFLGIPTSRPAETRSMDSRIMSYEMAIRTEQYNSGHDVLAMGEGVALGDLAFKMDGEDLKIGILEDSRPEAGLDAASFETLSDIVTLKDFFNENKRIETLRFSDGDALDLTRVVETSHIQDGEVIHTDESLIGYFESQGVELSTYDSISARSSTAGDSGNNDLSANYNEPAVIYGGGGDDVISGSQGKDMLSGDGGDDVLRGSLGDDDYIFGRGFGHDTITDDAGDDTLILGQGVVLSDLAFKVENGDLKIGLLDESQRAASLDAASFDALADIVTLTGFFDEKNRVENLRFSGGSTLDLAKLAEFTGITDGQVIKPNDAMMTHLAGQGFAVAGYDTGFAADVAINKTDNELSGTALNDIIDGGQGNDTISGGEGDDILAGGLGNDVLSGGAGDDAYRFELGDGRDVIINKDQNSSDDRLVFGDGIDSASVLFQSSGNDLLVKIAGTEDSLTIKSWYLGDEFRLDRFELSTGLYLMASDVDKLVEAMEVEDFDFSDVGDLELQDLPGSWPGAVAGNWRSTPLHVGTEMNDTLFGNADDDLIYGGAGDDALHGQDGDDTLYGGGGNDMLSGMEGDDVLSGGSGSDTLWGWLGNDELNGGAGDDELYGQQGDDFLNGGAGNDVFYGHEGKDVLNGDDGNDRVYGGTDDDVLYGGAGDDDLHGQGGDDTLYGGGGNDMLSGMEGNDVFFGGSGSDTLWGWLGNDVLNGGAGDDELYGQQGDDFLNGGAGDDVLHGHEGNDVLNGDDGNDRVYGEAGDDKLYGGAGNDALHGQEGNDVLFGDDGDDMLSGMEGNDVLSGGRGSDTLWGWLGNDVLNGGAGDDELYGQQGDDFLNGGAGDDVLHGHEGNDVLNGDDGNDVVYGGAGNDEYRFEVGDGRDVIMNHDALSSNDRVAFGDGIDPDNLWFRREGNDLTVEILGTGDQVTVRDWHLGAEFQVDRFQVSSGSSLTASDVQALVDAMAGFAPVPGEIAGPAPHDLPDSLKPVIAAQWQ